LISRETARNVAIILAAAAVVTASESVRNGARILYALLTLGILLGLAIFGYRLYRENRQRIAWLPQRQRYLLYALVALLVVLVAASNYLVSGPVTAVIAIAAIGLCVYGIYRIWTEASRYY
jgi:NhaP-type Na+/H+ or K+/H+ antiporter